MAKNRQQPKATQPATEQEAADSGYHIPVLLHETIEGLNIKPDGIYVDCTFGGGGHAKVVLSHLNNDGRLIAFDQDEDAKQNIPDDKRVTFVPHNFKHLYRFLRLHNITQVDGIMADLGVSSHQFDEGERGFSTRFNANLDMRMDRRQPTTAFDIVNTYSELQLHKLFEQYGEVTNAKTLARSIVQMRNNVSMQTIDGFKNALRELVKGNPKKYFAQVFQALRMEVNDEVGALKDMLSQTTQLLKPGGRLAIISFHSIEDRIVKNFFRRGSFNEPEDNPFTNHPTVSEFTIITKKPVVASDSEAKLNPRSRSAKLRVAEKK